MSREIKFRYWCTNGDQMSKPFKLQETCGKENWDVLVPMQYTGLKDKSGETYLYEGDIIGSDGVAIGNIYETPEIYQEGITLIIEGMGTKAWRDTEQEAINRGCFYAE